MELASELGQVKGQVDALTPERYTITLVNTEQYPFNNSKLTVALNCTYPNAYYQVAYAVEYSNGSVGNITVCNKLRNGFQIAYTGGATSVTLNIWICGTL